MDRSTEHRASSPETSHTNTKTVKWLIPFPSAKLLELEPPKTQQSTTTIEGPDGKRIKTPGKETTSDLTASLKIDFAGKNGCLKLFGLRNSPKGPVSATIALSPSGELVLKLQSVYSASISWTENIACGGEWHPAGQRYPYGPEEPGYYETHYREEVRTGTEDRTENTQKTLKGEAFARLYLTLLHASPPDQREPLLKYLERYCGDEVAKAKLSLREENQKLLLEASAALEAQLRELQAATLP